jgi:Rps23 Pro-64 3,4-dihydroxylase Tpa1-like proline 4-hydroxylase
MRELGARYQNNRPFPHIVIDDAFDPAMVKRVEQELAAFEDWDGEKAFFGSRRKRHCATWAKLPPATQRLLIDLNGPQFLPALEALTGISGLIPDPYLHGGGVHSIRRGGFLKIHADFNWHQRLQLHRRLNLLLYLNSDWNAAWGGALELWDADMTGRQVEIDPVFNRLVVFGTTDSSFHGHPEPLACPEDRVRNSIALYYYTATRPEHEVRRGRSDRTDYRERVPGEF